MQGRRYHAAALGLAAALVIILSFAPRGSAQPTGPNVEEHYRRAQEALNSKDYETAAQAWKAIAELVPDLPEARSNLALMYHQQKKYDLAIEQFREALRLNPRLISAIVFLGIDYYLTSRPQLAIEQLQRAASLEPRQALIRKWLGMSHLQAGNFGEAISALKECQKLDPEDHELTFYLGRTYLKLAMAAFHSIRSYGSESPWFFLLRGQQFEYQGRLDDSLVEYEHAKRIAPKLEGVHYQIARALEAQGETSRAITAFTQELLNHPSHLRAASGLIQSLTRLRLEAEAGELARLARQRYRGHPQALEILAKKPPPGASSPQVAPELAVHINEFLVAYGRNIQSDVAASPWTRRALEAILAEEPEQALRLAREAVAGVDSGEVRYWKARAHLQSNRPDEASQELIGLYQQEPADPEVAYYLQRAAEELSFRTLEDFVRLQPDSHLTRQLRAEYYEARGENAKAIEEYQRAVKLKPGATQVHLAIGDLYLAAKKYELALTAYQAELKNDPYSVGALTMAGEAYSRLGQIDKAKEALLRATRISPDSARAQKALGEFYFEHGNYPDAVRHLQRALALGNENDEALHYHLGRALGITGDREQAARHLSIVQKLKERQRKVSQERLEAAVSGQAQ